MREAKHVVVVVVVLLLLRAKLGWLGMGRRTGLGVRTR